MSSAKQVPAGAATEAAPAAEAVSMPFDLPTVLSVRDVTISYSGKPAVRNLTLDVPEHRVTAIIGPSGCGKSTFLRTLNRMNDLVLGVTVEGQVAYRGIDLYGADVDPVEVRRRIGMVFQKPNPFPKTIARNVSWGPSINGTPKHELDDLVEDSLRKAALWDEVKDRLGDSALGLSGGQQQRLCLARTLAMNPEVILMDEPCSALDPVSTGKIEELMFELKERFTIVIVTHNMQQAARVSDYTAFLEAGRLIEFDDTETVFTNPRESRTEEYVTGRFG